ncbi:hypothetical protein [Candidatus Poriferisodalis sp.]|uniref:hypothetical protein n=1 Tax=Candidatus Poriferisodalis sp. TaxID=3101277 RepID=UPI003B5219E8
MTSRPRSFAAVACAVVLLAAGCASGDDNAAARTADLEARIADLESDLEAALETAAPTTTTTTTTSTATTTAERYLSPAQREANCDEVSTANGVLVTAYNEAIEASHETLDALRAAGDAYEATPTDANWDRYVAAANAHATTRAANVAPAVGLRASYFEFIAACDGTDLFGPANILNAKAAVLAIDEDLAWFADQCADLEHLVTCPPEALRLAEADYPPIPD